jgi:hypothetical protein
MTTTLTAHDMLLTAYADDRAAYMHDTRDTFANSGERRKRHRRLFAAQGGVCLKCGDDMTPPPVLTATRAEREAYAALDSSAEWSHMVPARLWSSVRAGFRWGNLGLWHKSCNRAHGENRAYMSDLARPDLLWTGTTRNLPNV